MSALDCILLFSTTMLPPTAICTWFLLDAMFPKFSKKSNTSSDKENNEESDVLKESLSNNPSLKLWLDGYEKNIPEVEWTPEQIKEFDEKVARWKEENKERIEAYDKKENQILIDAINKLEEYEKEHPNEKSMINSCMLKWIVGWHAYEERLIKEGHSPSNYEAKPRISDIF